MVSYMLTVGEVFISEPHICAPGVSDAHLLKPQVLTWGIYILIKKKQKTFIKWRSSVKVCIPYRWC